MKRIFSLLVLPLFLCLLALTACGGTEGGGTTAGGTTMTESTSTVQTASAPVSGATGWRIVIPSGSSLLQHRGEDLAEKFTEAGAAAPTLVTDQSTPGDREILLGNVKTRSESTELANRVKQTSNQSVGAYIISFSGGRVIVNASSSGYLDDAIAYCANAFMTPNGLVFPADPWEVTVLIDQTSPDFPVLDADVLAGDTRMTALSAGKHTLDAAASEQTLELELGEALPDISASLFSPFSTVRVLPAEDGSSVTLRVTAGNGSAKEYRIFVTHKDTYTVPAKVMQYKGGASGAVTFVNDDSKRASAEWLATELAKRNLRATVAVIASWIGYNPETGATDAAQVAFWQSLLDAGAVDFACHSMRHTFWGLDDLGGSYDYYPYSSATTPLHAEIPAGRITEEVVTSGEVLRTLFPSQRFLTWIDAGVGYTIVNGQRMQGNGSETLKRLVRSTYLASRSTSRVVNNPATMDFYNIGSYMITHTEDITSWLAHVDGATTGGWSVFCIHQIAETGNGQTNSRANISALLDYTAPLTDAGTLWCPTFEEGVLYFAECRHARAEAVIGQSSVTVTLEDGLDDAIYNEPLTVRVPLPAGYTGGVTYAKATLTAQTDAAGSYVYADLVPNGEPAVFSLGG